MDLMNKIECRDCGEITWNRTERCNPCKKKFNEKKDKDEQTSVS